MVYNQRIFIFWTGNRGYISFAQPRQDCLQGPFLHGVTRVWMHFCNSRKKKTIKQFLQKIQSWHWELKWKKRDIERLKETKAFTWSYLVGPKIYGHLFANKWPICSIALEPARVRGSIPRVFANMDWPFFLLQKYILQWRLFGLHHLHCPNHPGEIVFGPHYWM